MLEAECIVAGLRMEDFLAGRPPPQLVVLDPTLAISAIREGLEAFLAGKTQLLPDTDVSWVFNLPDEIPEESFNAVATLPEPLVIPVTSVAVAGLSYLQRLTPTRTLPGLALRTAAMTDGERARLRRSALAIDSPVGCIVAPMLIATDHVNAIKQVYPELYGAACQEVGKAIMTLGRPLKAMEEVCLSRLTGAPVARMGVLDAEDQTQEGSPGQRPKQPPPRGEPASSTWVQKVAGDASKRGNP